MVIEILETVEPDDEIIQACHALKDQGYHLALDDVVAPPRSNPLLGQANRLGEVYRLVRAYEAGDWVTVTELARSANLPEDVLPALYEESVRWAAAVTACL